MDFRGLTQREEREERRRERRIREERGDPVPFLDHFKH